MGLKTLDAVADQVGPAATIAPTYDAFTATGRLSLDRAAATTDDISRRRAHERQRPHPHHPAHLHRRRVRGTAEGDTLAEVLDDLEANYAGIKARILDEQGELRRFVNVYVGNDDVRFLDALDTKTPDGTQISVIPAVAGGC